ncbi:MAG: DHHA1 domain-containing protein [Candidatus Pacearchaeota archaeon]|jgi:single-stranded DNA-specific DHH superfamily exonuclease
MLTQKQVKEIREHLERAQNPVFFFDNDQDGLCSFLLLQRFIERGKGVAIKSFPGLTKEYFRRANELNADYIFILDKPDVADEFFREARQVNIPIVWIDHHDMGKPKKRENVFYFNPSLGKKDYEATSLFCYQVSGKKEDLWIAVAGCIADAFVPPFYEEFKKTNPDLTIDSDNALDIYYTSEIGKVAKIFGAGLKDKTSNVVGMLKFLMKVKSPYDVLEENSKNYFMHRRFNEINKKFVKLIEKGVDAARANDKILFFEYGGDMSISSEVANALKQKFPSKTIVVGYMGGAKVNVSIRGKNVKEKILSVVKKLDNATGGGHEEAVGARVNIGDWEKFKELFRKES